MITFHWSDLFLVPVIAFWVFFSFYKIPNDRFGLGALLFGMAGLIGSLICVILWLVSK